MIALRKPAFLRENSDELPEFKNAKKNTAAYSEKTTISLPPIEKHRNLEKK